MRACRVTAVTPKSFLLTPAIADYLAQHNPAPDRVLSHLITETAGLGDIARMQIAPEQGAFLTQFVRLIGARQAIEVGTFTGFSSICIARGLGSDGHLLCCDVNEEWTDIARRHWALAGLESRVELRLAPALETLRGLPAAARFDFAFVDAMKTEYTDYYEELVPRLSARGVMMFDNVLWGGAVADSSIADADTVAIRSFNRHAADDPRTEAVMLPIADGVTVIARAD